MGKHWSDFWQQGHLTSFGCDLPGNYYGPLKELWLTFFGKVKKQDIQVLDIGSGNGPLAKIAAEAKLQPLSFHCVDAAIVETSKLSHGKNVFFYPETLAENLPFADNSIDIVISQFGIEYSNLEKAVREIDRVCKATATLNFVLHSTDSSIVAPNLKILEKLEELLNERSLFELIEKLIIAKSEKNIDLQYAEQIRAKLNAVLSRVSKHNQAGLYGSGLPVLLKSVFTTKGSMESKLSQLNVFKKEMQAQSSRLNELKLASRNELQVQSLWNRLNELGFKGEYFSILRQNQDEIIGWHITAKRKENNS